MGGTVPAWADGVRTVPLRTASPEALGGLNAQFRFGFSAAELQRLQTYFQREQRDPTDVELAGLAQSWSEHCSYKSSRPILRAHFGRLPRPARVLGTGDAGVIAYEPGWAYALRIESHNHPSAVEPYGGAATGIGGILRDVLAVGGKPVALADPIFFGPLATPPGEVPDGVKSPRYLQGGVVAGIRDYGNRVGVPTVSGGIYYDPAYIVNPLVNVGCVGLLPRSRLQPNRAHAAGDLLVLAGGLTGRDGLGGVAFASQELTERSEEESRGAVQLGNPIMKEPLIHACLEVFDHRLARGVKDLGGGGLASASGELVHAAGLGSEIALDRVPVREEGLQPWELWISESQERMLLGVRPRDLQRVLGIFEKHDVPAIDIGRVVPGGRERLSFRGRPAADLELTFRIEPPPVRRPRRAPPRSPGGSGRQLPEESPGALLEEMILAPDSVSREPVLRMYDHEVQGRTVIKPLHGRVTSPSHGDAAVIRPRRSSVRGLAITVAAQPWSCAIDPRAGGRWVVEEAARNLYAVGARPDAFSDCLNFGNPEDPAVLGQFDRVVRGLAEGARALGFVVPSGNVSLYNGGLGRAIPPTPVVLAVGVVPDVRRAVTSDLKEEGDPLYLLGRSSPNLGGSLYQRRRGRTGPLPPTDPAALRRWGERLLSAIGHGEVRAAHDISDGGLAVTLGEMAFGGALGFDVDLAATGLRDPALALVAEGGSRIVVEVARERETTFRRRFRGLPAARMGTVAGGNGLFRFGAPMVAELDGARTYARWRAGTSAADGSS
ncbi:MAG: phosphoribosylformylglycinamidine synthase subunit PurL [Thermoplasmata archaeon]